MSNKYVTNKEILAQVAEWHETEVMPEALGESFLIIARNLSNKSNFIGYTWKEDMIAEAVLTCIKYFGNFDPNKSNNPFAYITRICYNSFVNYIKKQNKHGKMKQDLYDIKDEVNHESFVAYKSIDYTDLLSKDDDKDKKGDTEKVDRYAPGKVTKIDIRTYKEEQK